MICKLQIMEKWILYAILSAVFAGCTSVIAKFGVNGISGEVGLAVRTCFVAIFVLAFSMIRMDKNAIGALSQQNILWLGVSAATTTVSWIFYYKAIELGEVSTIALIDKGSFLVAVFLAWLFLKEEITPRLLLGTALISGGLFVIARKP